MSRVKNQNSQQLRLLEFLENGSKSTVRRAQSLSGGQRLGGIIKSVRDIMRKDKGLNGDLDRLPMLTWIMFLKFLDDHEQIRADEAAIQK